MITKKEALVRNSLPQPQVDVCGEVSMMNSIVKVTNNFTGSGRGLVVRVLGSGL